MTDTASTAAGMSEQPMSVTQGPSVHRIVNNTVLSLAGQALTWMSTLLLTMAYGRYLGDVKFGELYFAITFVMLIGFPLDCFNQQITRDVAQRPEQALRYLSNMLAIKACGWLVIYGLVLVLCRVLGYGSEVRTLVTITGATLLLSSVTTTFASLNYSFEQVVFSVTGTVLEKCSSALAGLLLLSHGAGVETMAFVLMGGAFANSLWQASWFVRLHGIELRIDPLLAWRLLRLSLPFMLYGFIGVAYYRLDTVLLSLFTNSQVIGWYGAAYRIFDTMVFLPSLVISTIMYPVFSKLSHQSESLLRPTIEKSVNFVLYCGIPIATLMIVAAPNIIEVLYKRSEFAQSIPVLRGLAPGLVLLYVNSVFMSAVVSTGLEKRIAIQAGVALVFNLGLNLVAIPLYRHVGAAVVTSLTEGLLFCMYVGFSLPRQLLPVSSWLVAVKTIVAGLAMAAAIWMLRDSSILIVLPAAGLVYLAVATAIRAIPSEDLMTLLRIVGRRSGIAPSATVELGPAG